MSAGHPANSGANVDVSPAAAVHRNARVQPDSVAIRYAGGDLTFAGLDDRCARLATVLADGGVGTGDRVAYLGLNSPSFLVTMLAAHRLGAIFVPINFRLAEPELHGVLRSSGAATIVCEEGHRTVLEAVRDGTALKRFLLVDDDPEVPATPGQSEGWEPWSVLLARALPTAQLAARRFDDPAVIMFTSGTTGLPKGVVLTHGNIWWNAINVDTQLDTRRGDVTHAAAPIFHVGALNSFVIRTLVRGGTVVLRRAFDPGGFLRDLVTFRVNSFFAVPTMLAALARLPGVFDADLSALRAIVVAGAPVPPSLVEQYADHGIWLQQAWGLTETAPFATHLPVERTLDKLGSAGIAMPHTEVRVVEPATNTPIAPGTAGEIVVRGPNVTPGYWENPEATAAAFDDEGWFHSGDIGYLDDDGYLFIVDRLKDMIISGGENVYPAEVERALADMPGLADVAIVGAVDAQWGETVVAVVAVSANAAVSLDAVREHAAARLARYKLPRQLMVVETVPRNATGKLDKVAVRRILAEGT
ncbi:long-chain fatty acid--CoA ligase [Frankia sp. AgB1.9]|uniref:acyl-CoA synthetase n=1 Tax=unclassified Frankia TaxID=2632575 RepID=UPI0019342915|nr:MULTISPECIES: long-chain fatty acid--CoA ligase [unclassified Frankia]MBL7487655.1 long-chain fatty acid--CoA ligase [Frankia sp. AgW1.1]MBL7550033.1 long-chain fatty acid--CoA ligase [Frankia sp. AgB1.9]MBL7621902.1 long-chain fatty acid--CoA ligase [Frankia sp. AgB1.8]